MSEKRAYDHQSETAGVNQGKRTAETEHRDTARPTEQPPNELHPSERQGEPTRGPTTRRDTHIDPDPRFGETNE